MIASGAAGRVLVIGAEKLSTLLDVEDRSTAVLFGDGAGAVVLEQYEGTDRGILYNTMGSDGSGWQAGGPLAFPSEVTLLALLEAGASAPLCVVVATLGNVLGALLILAIGRGVARGGKLAQRWADRYGEDPEAVARARQRLDRYGSALLGLAWVPIVGDVIVFAAGLARVGWAPALFWITIGKAARYGLVAGGFVGIAG